MQWRILPFRRYAEFHGRSRRMEYWMFALLNVIVVTVLMIATGTLGALTDPASMAATDAEIAALFSGAGLIILLYCLAILVPSIAVTVRRLHDRNMSGWWYLGAILGSMIPIVGPLVSIAFLVLMALPGTPGPNRFGPDPKGDGAAEAAG